MRRTFGSTANFGRRAARNSSSRILQSVVERLEIRQLLSAVTGFANFTLNHQATNPAGVPAISTDNSTLTLTTAATDQSSSAFYNSPVGYQNFTASFTYTETPDSNGTTPPANGITFTLQNDPRGVNALGGSGGDLGYTTDIIQTAEPISPSFAIELNVYKVSSVSVATDGVTTISTNISNTGAVNLASGDPINVTLNYNSTLESLSETLTDASANTAYTTTYTDINLVNVLEGATAYVGFTGGTGTSDAGQTISNFIYSASPASQPSATSASSFAQFNLNAANGTGNNGSSPNDNNPAGVPAVSTDSNTLTLTTDAANEASSAFGNAAVSYNDFQANFTYTDVGGGTDDGGFTFALQDDPRGQTALGAGGGNVGSGSDGASTKIAPGLIVQFNLGAGEVIVNGSANFMNAALNDGAPWSISIGPDVVWTAPSVSLSSSAQPNTLYVMMSQSNHGESQSVLLSFLNINPAQLLDSPTAYVGFSGGTTNGLVQTISNFSYSAKPASQVNLGGYAETYGIQIDGTADLDVGYDGAGDALSYTFFGSTTGPSAQTYTSLSPAQTFYTLPPNAPDVVTAMGQTIAVPEGSYGNVSLLGSAVNGAQPDQTIQLNYTNGSFTTVTQSFSDWLTPQYYSNEHTAMTMNTRLGPTGAVVLVNYPAAVHLYEYNIPVNPDLTLASITLPIDKNIKILGINVNAVPVVTGVSPGPISLASGSTGSVVTISGNGFVGATAVDFGSTPATSFSVTTDGSIAAEVPAGTGTVDVTITGPNGTSLTSPADQFTYIPPQPSWLGPGSQATWNASTKTLMVTGFTVILSDPGSDEPNIVASGSAAQVIIEPGTSPTDFHIGGITLTDGASMVVDPSDRPTASDLAQGEYVASNHNSYHNVLVVGALGAANDPAFSIDATSTLNMEDNDLIIHTGSSDADGYKELAVVQGLAANGRNDGTWNGTELTSSVVKQQDASDGEESVQLGVVDNSDLASPFSSWKLGSASETVGDNDIIVKYTYSGDFNLDGKVDGNDYKIFAAYYDNGASTGNEWAFGDTNDDGKINSADYKNFVADCGNGGGGASVSDPYQL